jgi:hypothetical protein
MKIFEVTTRLNEEFDLGILANKLGDETQLKDKILRAVDIICADYKKKRYNDFSNAVGDEIRSTIVKLILNTFKLSSPEEVQQLKTTINNYISDKYLDYKINDRMPEEENERTVYRR